MKQEIKTLQKVMKNHGLTMYMVPTSDEHQSEYIPEYYKFRAYLTGFTGSAGTLLVTQEECLLWTDGRYFIQAEKQLENTGIILMRSGEKNVPTISEYISSHINEQDRLGFDASLFGYEQMRDLLEVVERAGADYMDLGLTNEVWTNHPALQIGKIKKLGIQYTGNTTESKIEKIKNEMIRLVADVHIISSLDDIAWIFNLRGCDIPYNPVFYSYAVISAEKTVLYVKKKAMIDEIRRDLENQRIIIADYDQFFEDLAAHYSNKRILLDTAKTSYRTYDVLKKNNQIVEHDNPSALMKALKTEEECTNIIKAHITDGFLVTRFIYWLKKQIADGVIVTECEAADYLDRLRLEHDDCCDLSFDTIAAYGKNAAMCHYSPDRKHPVRIENQGFLLVDSGGQYLEGTTDVTRTIAVGSLTKEQKEHYTLVLQGHIRLSMVKFPVGVCGANLDILARGPLWNRGLDFNHGTGHGVGYYLNVHEGPNNIHWNLQRKTAKTTPLQPGMLTSNEPGLYLQDQYGIRIENLILTKKVDEGQENGFLEFLTVTKVPYEREAVIAEMLSDEELAWFNAYHAEVYELFAQKLSKEERIWLKAVTEPLSKNTKQ